MLKWKRFCKENNINTKGKKLKWFEYITKEVTNEDKEKNKIATWNNNNDVIFA
ncbi:hypothetical protein RhiirA1_474978 [Rhizophagus irregularis]|uniref:Uncharacterized protein n=1 Tax=Rhizophagus irregularis TaxID=588596 RepID=A0A2N0QXM0_9GLOM|nr:hypothetical protein RhiirA1_474978 [Rhizophagus irregularis]